MIRLNFRNIPNSSCIHHIHNGDWMAMQSGFNNSHYRHPHSKSILCTVLNECVCVRACPFFSGRCAIEHFQLTALIPLLLSLISYWARYHHRMPCVRVRIKTSQEKESHDRTNSARYQHITQVHITIGINVCACVRTRQHHPKFGTDSQL